MKSLIWTYLLIIVLSVACSRNNDIDNALSHAESVMEDYPDSALAILDTINPASLSGGRQNALYALLITQARYKNYCLADDDTLIDVALNYFDAHGSQRHRMLSHLYKAELLMRNSDFRRSMDHALFANELAYSVGDIFYIGKTHNELAELSNTSYHPEDGIMHDQLAIHYYKKAKKDRYAYFSELDLAIKFDNIGEEERALELLDSVSKFCPDTTTAYRSYLTECYIIPLVYLGRDDEALEKYYLYKSMIDEDSYSPDDIDAQVLMEVARVYIKKHMLDSAEYYVEKSLSVSSVDAHIRYGLLYKIALERGDTALALHHHEKRYSAYYKKMDTMLHQSITASERDYLSQKSEQEKLRSEKYRMQLIFISVLVVVILVSFFLFHRMRLKNRKEEIESQMLHVKQLSEELSGRNSLIESLNRRIELHNRQLDKLSDTVNRQSDMLYEKSCVLDSLFSDWFASLDALSSEYFEKKDSAKVKATLISDFEKELDKMKSPEFLQKLHKLVNGALDNVLVKIRTQLPKIKEQDIDFIAYILAGFSPRSVCLFTDNKIKNFYNKRSRLINRIEESDAPDKDFILSVLYKRMNSK